jgi:hypothetical protein
VDTYTHVQLLRASEQPPDGMTAATYRKTARTTNTAHLITTTSQTPTEAKPSITYPTGRGHFLKFLMENFHQSSNFSFHFLCVNESKYSEASVYSSHFSSKTNLL